LRSRGRERDPFVFPLHGVAHVVDSNVFHSQAMLDAVVQLLRDHLPAGQDFVIKNLNALVKTRQRVKMASLVILLITSTGVFLPLEVAFNRIWGFAKNRSYLGNQIISLLLVLLAEFWPWHPWL